MANRISSLDAGYQTGDLSVYPAAIDDKNNLYEAKNNTETKLKQSLNYNGKIIVVEDTSGFPDTGLIRLGPPAGEPGQAELVYYDSKTSVLFKNLIRGFAGSRQSFWPIGTDVSGAVMAEHHNAIKDAIVNIEATLGKKTNPAAGSFNATLTELETKFLAPRPMFRSYPLRGKPPLEVKFQNFSDGNAVSWLWDFGDGSTSIEKSPTHTYQTEGVFTVKLNLITTSGAQGSCNKSNYITVSNDVLTPFFYVQLVDSDSPAYSIQTATALSSTPGEFLFVDQTDGDILQRFWVFDDGDTLNAPDPDVHTAKHIYTTPGTYSPSLLIILANQQLKRVFLSEAIIVL